MGEDLSIKKRVGMLTPLQSEQSIYITRGGRIDATICATSKKESCVELKFVSDINMERCDLRICAPRADKSCTEYTGAS